MSDLGYYMVPVTEAISFTYPVAASSEDDAKRLVDELLASKRLSPPHSMLDRYCGDAVQVGDPVASSEEACRSVASSSLSSLEADRLLGNGPVDVSAASTPETMARAARASLKRTGSGALQPSKRNRL